MLKTLFVVICNLWCPCSFRCSQLVIWHKIISSNQQTNQNNTVLVFCRLALCWRILSMLHQDTYNSALAFTSYLCGALRSAGLKTKLSSKVLSEPTSFRGGSPSFPDSLSYVGDFQTHILKVILSPALPPRLSACLLFLPIYHLLPQVTMACSFLF